MQHRCNEYCLGPVDKAGIWLWKCCFSYRQEATSNKGDTPGKDLLPKATIVKERGIEHLHLPRVHSRTVVQHSQTVLQAWRANADVQLLIYRSNPDIPDVGEIEAVSKYCTAYAGKTHHTTREEINTIQDTCHLRVSSFIWAVSQVSNNLTRQHITGWIINGIWFDPKIYMSCCQTGHTIAI